MHPAWSLPPTMRAPRSSRLTALERGAYLHRRGDLDMTYLYPEGLEPGWFDRHRIRPPDDFLRRPPGHLIDIVGQHFRNLFGAEHDVFLAPSCSMAFGIAAAAVLRPGDEVIVIDRSFEPWPVMLETFGATVVYARRTAAGVPDVDSIAGLCGARTRAVVIVSPDNPEGVICPAHVLANIGTLCTRKGLTLIADHCLAEVNPFGRVIPLLPRMASRHLSWIALGDTGKLLFGLPGPKLGAVAYSAGWGEHVEAAASPWFYSYDQYGLTVLAAILSDPQFGAYRAALSAVVATNYEYLTAHVKEPLRVGPLGAGSAALIDAAGADLDGEQFAKRLAGRRVIVTPVSWFPAGSPGLDTRVRVALARPFKTIDILTEALNRAAR